MKVFPLVAGFLVSIVAAFAAGVYLSIQYVADPIVERSILFERKMLELQVVASSAVQRGSTQEMMVYLRGRNVYSLFLLASDKAEVKKLKNSPSLLESVDIACDDIRKNLNGIASTGMETGSIVEACNALLSKQTSATK